MVECENIHVGIGSCFDLLGVSVASLKFELGCECEFVNHWSDRVDAVVVV